MLSFKDRARFRCSDEWLEVFSEIILEICPQLAINMPSTAQKYSEESEKYKQSLC